MNNLSGPVVRNVSASLYYTPQRAMSTARPLRYRGRHRSARPYLAMLPEPETLVLPTITEDTAPPALTQPRAVGPWLENHECTGPAEDMADLRSDEHTSELQSRGHLVL